MASSTFMSISTARHPGRENSTRGSRFPLASIDGRCHRSTRVTLPGSTGRVRARHGDRAEQDADATVPFDDRAELDGVEAGVALGDDGDVGRRAGRDAERDRDAALLVGRENAGTRRDAVARAARRGGTRAMTRRRSASGLAPWL